MDGSSSSGLYAVTPLSDASPPNDNPQVPPVPSQPKPRNKLGPEAIAILEAYWLKNPNPTQLPPLDARKELTKTIKEFPGCAYWNQSKTSEWFRRRMKKLQPGPAKPTVSSPSMEALQHLTVLLKSQPNPSSDVIKTWATLLAREGGAMEFWIGYISRAVRDLQASNPDSEPTPSSANLPTPAGTVTPEPRGFVPRLASHTSSSDDSAALSIKMKHDPADSPTIASLSIRSPTEPSPSSPSSTAHFGPPTLLSWPPRAQTRPRKSLHAIVQGAVQELSTQGPTENTGPLPNNADDFVAMFAPYEDKLTKLQRMLDSRP